MTKKVLLAGDVDAIKEFVFETSSLPQIRGATECLLECEERIRGELRQKFDYEVVYCSGGSFLLDVPAESAERVAQAVERLYLETTKVATVTVVFETGVPTMESPNASVDGWAGRIASASTAALATGPFGRRAASLATGMWEAKNGKSGAPFFEALPVGRRCDRCGKRMASSIEPMEPGKALCMPCNLRDSLGRKKWGVHGKEIRGRFNQQFWQQHGAGWGAEQPEDLDTLVQGAKRGYLAVLYADGNDIGHLLRRAESPHELSVLSSALVMGTRKALFDALTATCGGVLQGEGGYWPFDIVNIGGDDVTVIVQAGYAWELAVEFLERFQLEVTEALRRALNGSWLTESVLPTASCGIAIADARYPVRYLERLAADLLRDAKKVAKADVHHPESAVTFLWLPTPVASESAAPLMVYYSRRPGRGAPMLLTARPYTVSQARQLLGCVKGIATWPRTIRHRWAEALEKGVLTSVNAIHYDIGRRTRDQQGLYETLVRIGALSAGRDLGAEIPAPVWYWHRDGEEGVWRTALLDALELAELQAARPDLEEVEE